MSASLDGFHASLFDLTLVARETRSFSRAKSHRDIVTFHLDICFWQTYSTHAPFIDRMPFSRQEESIFSMLFTPNLLYLLSISYFPLYWKNTMRMHLI